MNDHQFEYCHACGDAVSVEVNTFSGGVFLRCCQCHRTIDVIYDEDLTDGQQ